MGPAAAGVKGACLPPQPTLTQLYGLGRPGAVEPTGVLLLSSDRRIFFHGPEELLQYLNYKKKDAGIFFISTKNASQTLPRFLPKWEHPHRCLYPE